MSQSSTQNAKTAHKATRAYANLATSNTPKDSLSSHSVNSHSLSKFQRLRQYQPSQKLVKTLFVWWMGIVFLSALTISHGFGNAALFDMSQAVQQWLPLIGGLALLAIFLTALFDLCCLISLSQSSRYKLDRQYPSNVPVLHQLDIIAHLSFDVQPKAGQQSRLFDNFVYSLLSNRTIKAVTVDFYDHYPDHLALIEPDGTADSVTVDEVAVNKELGTNNNKHQPLSAMPIRAVIAISDTIENINNAQPAVQTQLDTFKAIQIDYPVIAIQRGTGYFGAASIRVWSPLQLFKRQFQLSSVEDNHKYLRVLADFSGLLNNQLSAVFEQSVDAGMQSILQQGSGSDFLKLREYTPGDAIRQIDWKASSRQRRLMSKSYEDDNDQEVMFLLDCGEQMRHQDITATNDIMDGAMSLGMEQTDPQISYFDKVLNAVLLLSYIVNKQGDRVGLMSFAGNELYLSPKKGTSLVRNLLNSTADLKPTMLTSDYVSAAQDLVNRLSKRSLVILITNTRAEASAELTQALKLLSRRHQVVFANLTEQIVVDHLQGDIPPADFDDALLYHALTDYQLARQTLHKQLSQQTGALCLQTTANQLPMKLTQAYLSLKRG